MFSFKSVWYLPFTVLAFTFLLCTSVGLWFHQWIVSDPWSRPSTAIDNLVSPNTLNAINGDARLQGTILSVTEAIAKASSEYGETYDLAGLKGLGKNLTKEIERLKALHVPTEKIKRRGFLDGIIPGGQGDGGGGFLDGLLGGTGNSSEGLGGLLQQALSGLGSNLAGSLATPALFLGIGLGMGTSTGLNLTDEAKAKEIAAQVASSMGMEATGFNQVAQNLGTGLAAQLAPSLGNSTTDIPVGMVAYSLAQGIGQGSASGLNLTQQKFEPKNGSDFMTIAGNIGLGLSYPIASSIDTQQLFSQSGLDNEQLAAQIPQIAMAAGQGLGSGAVKGLRLDKLGNATGGGLLGKRQAPASPGQLDIAGAVGNFTSGLSEAFLQSADLSKLVDPNAFKMNLDGKGVIAFASGAGKGLGEGLAIGFNFTNGTIMSPQTDTAGIDSNQEQIAEELVKGLVAGFLQNGGTTAANKALTSGTGGLTSDINPGLLAEGAARGLVEGAVNGLSQAGGLRNVLSGNFSKDLPMNLPSLPPTTFNDSVGGAAVSFARGLSGEGLLLVAQYMNAGKNGSAQPPSKRSIASMGVVPYDRIIRRDTGSAALAIDSMTLEGLAQSGINALTCSGVGGVAAAALGIMDNPALKNNDKKSSALLDNATLAALPRDPIRLESEGNTFVINIVDQSVEINGRAIISFGIILGLHILFTTLAFFVVLPIYVVLGAVMRISVMINLPFNETKNKKWRKISLFYIFSPLALVGMVLGFVATGTSRHMQTGHGILGLIVLLITVPTVIVTFFRLRTSISQPGPSAFRSIKQVPKLLKGPQKVHVYSSILVQLTIGLGTVCWTEGWTDLRSITLCVIDAVLTSGVMANLASVAMFLQFSSMAILGLRHYLEVRIAKFEAAGQRIENIITEYGGAKATDRIMQMKRSSTIKTFGFDAGSAPPALNAVQNETRNTVRTVSLQGREDSQIGWPSQVRRFGEADTIPAPARPAVPNPFRETIVSPLDPPAKTSRIYNPKLGGFEDDRSPLFPPPPQMPALNEKTGSVSVYSEFRPSSEIEPQKQLPPAPMLPGTSANVGIVMNEGGKARKKESFSRPFDGRPSGEGRR